MTKNLKEAAGGIFPVSEEKVRPAARPVAGPWSIGLPLLLTGLVAGAALAYFNDPVRGRRRRAEVKQRGAHLRRQAERWGGRTYRDLRNRSRGWFHEAAKLARRAGAVRLAPADSAQNSTYLH